jgi:hypothetical protein
MLMARITIGQLRRKMAKDPASLTLDEARAAKSLPGFLPAAVDEEDRWWVSRKEAAALLGCTTMNVDKLTHEDKVARGVGKHRGLIDLRSLFAYVRGQSRKSKAKGDEAEVEAETQRQASRFRKSKADLAQLAYEKQAGQLLKKDDVLASLALAGQTLKVLLHDLVTRLPEKLAGAEIREAADILDKEYDAVLKQFGEEIKKAVEPRA